MSDRFWQQDRTAVRLVVAAMQAWPLHWSAWGGGGRLSNVVGEEPARQGLVRPAVDEALTSMRLRVLKTPIGVPQANAFCERLIGTARRECLDYVIPFNERHLRRVLAEWVAHYNGGPPHASLGPGIPDQSANLVIARAGHEIPAAHRVISRSILGGLHHEYRL